MRGNPQLCLLTANSGVQQELHAAGLGRREKNQQLQEPLFSRNLRLVEVLRSIGGKYGKSPGEVAIAWVLRQPAVTGAIVGAR